MGWSCHERGRSHPVPGFESDGCWWESRSNHPSFFTKVPLIYCRARRRTRPSTIAVGSIARETVIERGGGDVGGWEVW